MLRESFEIHQYLNGDLLALVRGGSNTAATTDPIDLRGMGGSFRSRHSKSLMILSCQHFWELECRKYKWT